MPYNTILRRHGDYRKLLSYKKSDVIYRLTFRFCERFLNRGDRTIDQMVQAARSCKQNIVEGSEAAAASLQTEMKLLNVAKASLQELLEDYTDYLHTRGHSIWMSDSEQVQAMRRLGREHEDAEFFLTLAETRPDSTVANMALVLIHQADTLLRSQLEKCEERFREEGGWTEHMAHMRREYRQNQNKK